MPNPRGPYWQRADGVILCSADGENSLLIRDSWCMVRLDDVARRIWDLLAEPHTTESLVDELIAQYDVTRDQCHSDILPVLTDLHGTGAILSVETSQQERLDSVTTTSGSQVNQPMVGHDPASQPASTSRPEGRCG
jgi:hypothetical protein